MSDYNQIAKSIQKQQEELTKLENVVAALTNSERIPFSKLQEENEKLKYRLHHIERSLKAAEDMKLNYSISIIDVLVALFDNALRSAYPEVLSIDISLAPCTNAKFGDYQCNNAMELCKHFKKIGINKAPKEIAQEIVSKLIDCDILSKVEVAPSGFINVFLKHEFVSKEIVKIIRQGVLPPKMEKKKVVVDYSSPNIAKEMHVGHLRSTIIGDCLARLFRYLGNDVKAVNHIGDWGTQFGMLIAHLYENYPKFKEGNVPISDLQAFYKESKKRFDSDEEFKKRAYKAVVELQSHNPDSLVAWKLICDISRREFEKIYDRLCVKDLQEVGESFYQDKMESLVTDLDKRGLLELDEGRKLLRCKESEIHMLMVKSDGGFTYDTSDMAALAHRVNHEKADWMFYVVDNGQGNHFEGLFACSRAIGLCDASRHRLEHVGFGVVLGEDGKKFKSRSSETVRLADLLDEGIERAGAKLIEKGRDQELTPQELEKAQKAVAYGCIKYADLSHHRTKEYLFSFDKMLEDKGNTAVYLLYAYTRISGISRNAKISQEALIQYLDSINNELPLDHEKEWKLGKILSRFPEKLKNLVEELTPHTLCEYLYNLCCTFTEFYEACYCVEKDKTTGQVIKINYNRIVLSEATAAVLRTGFQILGLEFVERM